MTAKQGHFNRVSRHDVHSPLSTTTQLDMAVTTNTCETPAYSFIAEAWLSPDSIGWYQVAKYGLFIILGVSFDIFSGPVDGTHTLRFSGMALGYYSGRG